MAKNGAGEIRDLVYEWPQLIIILKNLLRSLLVDANLHEFRGWLFYA
jgi:hypothetical protein